MMSIRQCARNVQHWRRRRALRGLHETVSERVKYGLALSYRATPEKLRGGEELIVTAVI